MSNLDLHLISMNDNVDFRDFDISVKDTPTICKKWGKSKFFIFREYLSP